MIFTCIALIVGISIKNKSNKMRPRVGNGWFNNDNNSTDDDYRLAEYEDLNFDHVYVNYEPIDGGENDSTAEVPLPVDGTSPSASPGDNISDGTAPELGASPSSSPIGLDFNDEYQESSRAESLMNIISKITSQGEMTNQSSPQYKAMNWIKNTDPLQMNPGLSKAKEIRFLERYAVSVLYYSFSDTDFEMFKNWFSAEDICDWNFLVCGIITNPEYTGNNKRGEDKDTSSSPGLMQKGNRRMRMREHASKGNSRRLRDDDSNKAGYRANDQSKIVIPESAGLMVLKSLDLSNLGLVGSIPDEIGGLVYLEKLHLNNNNLTGTIPSIISQSTNLISLQLQSNHFHSTIPSSISSLVKLEVLDLEYNDFTGVLPESLCDLPNLPQDFGINFETTLPGLSCDCCAKSNNNAHTTSSTYIEEDTIFGFVDGDNYGFSVSLSANGNIMSVGYLFADEGTIRCMVRVYNNINSRTNHIAGTRRRTIENEDKYWSRMGEDLKTNFRSEVDVTEVIPNNAHQQKGYSISLSRDGTRVAIGDVGDDVGVVRVYENRSEEGWTMVGNEIRTTSSKTDFFGHSTSLSSDGNVLAVGAPNAGENHNGRVYIYHFSENNWVLERNDGSEMIIDGNGGHFGHALSLSSDGNILAVGAPNSAQNIGDSINVTDATDNDNSGGGGGYVTVFKRMNPNNLWYAYDITAPADDNTEHAEQNDYFGYSISLSGDGSRLAIGSPGFDVLSKTGQKQIDAGIVTTLKFNQDLNEWEELGNTTIAGNAEFTSLGVSVSFSDSGNSLAVGAPGNGIKDDKPGYANVYQLEEEEGQGFWKLSGNLNGRDALDGFGSSVSVSADGGVFLVGSPMVKNGERGDVILYRWLHA